MKNLKYYFGQFAPKELIKRDILINVPFAGAFIKHLLSDKHLQHMQNLNVHLNDDLQKK